ncbi:hypothetical protein QFZ22_008177 [Streptomyces canus]|uniref:Uncharacterized protein n=1 Tax=Streptomyces canus TaxID=58343 RepID=A0AAW8FQY3_9ACTN|nr:hypothetical protein [Streptomyces canus]
MEDLVAHAGMGLEEFFFDLQGGMRNARELKDVAAELYEKARAAGV